jgi:hypothetical protein
MLLVKTLDGIANTGFIIIRRTGFALMFLTLLLVGFNCQKKQQTVQQVKSQAATQKSAPSLVKVGEPPRADTQTAVQERLPDSSGDTVPQADSLTPYTKPAVDSIESWRLSEIGLLPCQQDTCNIDSIPSAAVSTFTLQPVSMAAVPFDSSGYGAVCDSITALQGSIPSLDSVCVLSGRIIYTRAKFFATGNSDTFANSMVAPLMQTGFDRILAYKRLLDFGVPLPGSIPSIVRTGPVADSLSRRILPKAGNSAYLSGGRFFFLGGGPFLKRFRKDTTFTDGRGKPEIRFSCSINWNTAYILKILRRINRVRINVGFGPPLVSYDLGPQDINGIGSLVHELVNRIPVFFLTEEGAVPGQLIAVNQKLVAESLGCVSDLPEVFFSCATIPNEEILGVYLPYDTDTPPSCTVSHNKRRWTADLNNDGIPEFAAVSHTFIGATQETLVFIIWYANIGGRWQMVDQAAELDCT